jgi:RNA polymerase sigma factor (sigma-70 family)
MSDERLARRAAKGDRRAFEAIFRRYHQELYRFCLATVGNPQDAQDALQNTMVKMLRALPGEERQIKLKPWLYRIARNEAIETVRRRRPHAELGPEQPGAAPALAETAETRQRLRDLLADLEQLPERQRAALTMRELSGLGFEQIAEALGTSPAVVRQTVYEARLSLRQMTVGREMRCQEVMRELSDDDGRVTRRRELRAHLRDCAECRAFRDGIAERRGELAAIAPLPVALSAGLLHGALEGGAAAITGGVAATGAGGGLGGAAGAGVAASAVAKTAATVAVVAAVGVGAADRGGLIEAPVLGGNEAAISPERPPGPGHATPAVGIGADRGEARRKAGDDDGAAEQAGDDARRRETDSRRAAAARKRPGVPKGGPRASGGRPQGLPAAANRGQQGATERKAPQANPAPGPSGARGTQGVSGSSPAPPPPAKQQQPPQERISASPPPAAEKPAAAPPLPGNGEDG